MGAINWKILNPDTGEVVKYYTDKLTEFDVCTDYGTSDTNMYSNCEFTNNGTEGTYVPGTYQQAALAPVVASSIDSEINCAFMFPRSNIRYRRFKNPIDTVHPMQIVIPYERLLDLYAGTYSELDLHRLVVSTANMKLYIKRIIRESYRDIYTKSSLAQDLERVYRFDITIAVYDRHDVYIGEFRVPNKYLKFCYNGDGWNPNLIVTLFIINKFNPKYTAGSYSRYNYTGYIVNNGYIQTGENESGEITKTNEFGAYMVVPFAIQMPTRYSAYVSRTDWEFTFDKDPIELLNKYIFTDTGLLGEFGGDPFFNWYNNERGVIKYVNTSLGQETGYLDSNIPVQIYIPHRPVIDFNHEPVVYVSMSYGFEKEGGDEPKKPTTDVPTDKEGAGNDGDFDGYDKIPSDETNGTNGLTVETYNNLHKANFINFIFNKWYRDFEESSGYDISAGSSMVEDIYKITGSNLLKTLYQIVGLGGVDNIITRCYELPFKTSALYGDESGLVQVCPYYGNSGPLCCGYTTEGLSWDLIKDILALTNPVTAIGHTITALVTPESLIPGLRAETHWYNAVRKRWIEIDYGVKRIYRMFGNSLDFTDTTYILNLPFGAGTFSIDPNMLFRDADGTLTDEGKLSIKGILDLDTGGMLLNVLANDNLIYQTTASPASDRIVVGENSAAQLMNGVNALKDLTQKGYNAINSVVDVRTGTNKLKSSGRSVDEMRGARDFENSLPSGETSVMEQMMNLGTPNNAPMAPDILAHNLITPNNSGVLGLPYNPNVVLPGTTAYVTPYQHNQINRTSLEMQHNFAVENKAKESAGYWARYHGFQNSGGTVDRGPGWFEIP